MIYRSQEVTGWLFHGTRLCQERFSKLPDDADPKLRDRLNYEVRVRDFVIAHLHQAERLRGSARVWFIYMMCKAHLSIRWYDNRVDDETFYATCRRLRSERDAEDNKQIGVIWITPDDDFISEDVA